MVDTDEKDVSVGKKDKKTTLTIVQDFPKKSTDKKPVTKELVQGKSGEGDLNFYRSFGQHFSSHAQKEGSEQKATTLTIVQDFPKKKVTPGSSIEMVHT